MLSGSNLFARCYLPISLSEQLQPFAELSRVSDAKRHIVIEEEVDLCINCLPCCLNGIWFDDSVVADEGLLLLGFVTLDGVRWRRRHDSLATASVLDPHRGSSRRGEGRRGGWRREIIIVVVD